jgi:hypothetical protein
MTAVRLGIDAYRRFRAGEPEIVLENRYFEKNPTNLVEQVALIVRPALRYRTLMGEGPIRQVAYQSGCFGNDLFVVSGEELFRVKRNVGIGGESLADTVTLIPGAIGGLEFEITPEFAIRSDRVFVADGYDLLQTDGVAALAPIVTPDDIPPISMDYINHYIIVVMSDSQRCYWINPGEITIDPLNFFEAERLPDYILQVRTVGDQFWLLGQKTTEVWRHTGNSLAPFQRTEGRLFDRGIWGGTAVKIKDSVVVVGNDGMVYDVQGGPQPISNPGIAEMIRDAIKSQGLE